MSEPAQIIPISGRSASGSTEEAFALASPEQFRETHRTTVTPGMPEAVLRALGISSTADLHPESTPATSTDMTREEMDAKLQAAEARIEATEHRIDAALTRMEARISHLPSTWAMIGTTFTASVAIVGLILGVLAFGGDRFDGGVQLASTSAETAARAVLTSEQNARQIESLTQRVDQLLNALQRPGPAPKQ